MKTIKPLVIKKGNGKPMVAVIGAMHGNESGATIISRLQKTITLQKGTVLFIIANPAALEKNVRFLDSDLNRIFPGNPDGNREEQLAHQLVTITKDCDYVLDLHSCSMESQPFCIIRNKDAKNMQLANMTKVPNIVIYPLKTQHGGSLIDYASCGIGLELGLHHKEETIVAGYAAIRNVLVQLNMIKEFTDTKPTKQKIFRVEKHMPRSRALQLNKEIKNFELIQQGSMIGRTEKRIKKAKEDFYPIMYGQKSYNKILCWVAKML